MPRFTPPSPTFRGLYVFLNLQENVRNTAQLNSERRKAMRAYVYYICSIYFDCISIKQSVEIVSQSVRVDYVVAFNDMAFDRILCRGTL